MPDDCPTYSSKMIDVIGNIVVNEKNGLRTPLADVHQVRNDTFFRIRTECPAVHSVDGTELAIERASPGGFGHIHRDMQKVKTICQAGAAIRECDLVQVHQGPISIVHPSVRQAVAETLYAAQVGGRFFKR